MKQTCVELYNLYKSGKFDDAQALQKEVAVAEWGFAKGGINGTKWVVAKKLGYPEESAHCRRPYPKYSNVEKKQWVLNKVAGLDLVENRP